MKMQLLPLTLISLISLLLSFGSATQIVHKHLQKKQLAQGGGIAPVTLAATQFPVTSYVASLVTVGGSTTTKFVSFTQTFAATALGTWDLGPTPLSGAIGLGDIKGTLGSVHQKRAVETPAPRADTGSW